MKWKCVSKLLSVCWRLGYEEQVLLGQCLVTVDRTRGV